MHIQSNAKGCKKMDRMAGCERLMQQHPHFYQIEVIKISKNAAVRWNEQLIKRANMEFNFY